MGEPRAENIIIVGTGDVFGRFLAPALGFLRNQGLLEILATLDIGERQAVEGFAEGVQHRIRRPHEPLSILLSDLKEKNPIVILAHDNDLHYEDTKDLVGGGFRVMLEKPYVTERRQLDSLKQLISQNPRKVFLMGYYFMRKMAPLFLVAGALRKDSFYLTTQEVFKKKENPRSLETYAGTMQEVLGDPVSLTVTTLESIGSSGKLDHRGSYVFDSRRGGGMIQDMGIHALLPLFILEEYLGKVDASFAAGRVKTAMCRECYDLSKRQHDIPEEHIAETYAEITLETEKGVPVSVRVGKYTADAPAQKNVVLRGKKGIIDLDMHEHCMSMYKEDKLVDRIELVNIPGSKYYPVVRTGLEYFKGQSPYVIDFSQKQLQAQELTLQVLEKARKSRRSAMYDGGEQPEHIFKQQ